jgi:hypothetical protein
MRKRDFLGAGFGAGIGLAAAGAFAQPAKPALHGPRPIPHRMARTTKLFKSPGMYPNAIAVAPEGLWIGQQKISPAQAKAWNQPVPTNRDEAAWLVDWNGKLLKTVMTHSRNTSGMAYGDGCVWMGANAAPFGIFQVDMNSRQISHRQIPLALASIAGCHGCQWHNGKLWIVANDLKGMLRVDPRTWAPEAFIPILIEPGRDRWHDMTFDSEGNIWQVIGNHSTSYATGKAGLVKYDGKTGKPLMTVAFVPGSCDPHGLEFHNGALISCDAGVHPGWKDLESPASGYVFRIDLV